jgi:CMP-N-acetylneuraminic acid synthetase
MSSIIIFPIKSYSERVPGKNFLLLPDGRKLYQTTTMKALEADCFDKVVIDTDSEEIKDWARSVSIDVLDRLPEHTSNEVNGNILLRHHVKKFPYYDEYWQGFVTTPYISARSITNVFYGLWGNWDSAMAVKAHRGFFWSSIGPITFRTDVLPRGQELPEIYEEKSGLFGITAKAFERTQSRVGVNPYLFVLPQEECAEVDWPADVSSLSK